MIRSQCWFTFYFILHLNYIEPLLNDVKQLLIAAIMPSKEGRVPLEGPFVRDTSQDHKSSGKCPPGFPLTTSGILWYEPVLETETTEVDRWKSKLSHYDSPKRRSSGPGLVARVGVPLILFFLVYEAGSLKDFFPDIGLQSLVQ
ncbi:hypothetical protein Salat_2984400 [Sesamum alatum]|uniref:Uncharacterized protein n=1 Tax=Sesamum alatum TaxID=300844 RepID=A0AAE1XID3_9LAMI|nr:hypothetical protein Salat_2984400 [Sesamum alatum]